MRNLFYKYKPKIIVSVFSLLLLISCVRKHKFDKDKRQLSDTKFSQVLSDAFLMEAYINEKFKTLNTDSLVILKKTFYPAILKQHKVDSAAFYSTFNYYQAHPKEFLNILSLVDSVLLKIKPLDTTSINIDTIQPPKDVEELLNFRGKASDLVKMKHADSNIVKKIKQYHTIK
jgi:hypothetical protein